MIVGAWLRENKWYIRALSILNAFVLLCTFAAAANVEQPKRVLILYSFDKENVINAALDQNLRSNLRSQLPGRVEFYTEYLDLARFPDPRHLETLVELLKLEFKDKKPDLIIPVSYAALKFLFDGGKELLPGVPIVAFFDKRREPAVNAALKQSPWRQEFTSVQTYDEPDGSLKLALKLQPDTENVVVVEGSSESEKFWLQVLRQGFAPYSGKLSFDYTVDQTMPEIRRHLAALPPHTIILYGYFFEDSSGQSFLPDEALDLIESSANAPVYGTYKAYLDHGIVGGLISNSEQSGAELASLAARVLNGEKASAIPMTVDSSFHDVVDWRQLRRWGISEKRVPAGILVVDREPSLWGKYRLYVVFALFLIFFEGALVLALLLEGLRRRRTEKRLLRQSAFADALIEAFPGALFVQNEHHKNLRWNENGERLMRFHPATVPPLGNVSESNRQKAMLMGQQVLKEGKAEGELEVLAKSGHEIPFYLNASRMVLDNKRYIIISGVDITELKRAQDELKVSEERFSSAFEHAPIGMALVSPHGRYLKVNDALCRMVGYTAEELQTKSFRDITHPDDIEVDLENTRRVLAGEHSSYYGREKRYIHRSGQVVWISVATTLVRDSSGAPLYFVTQIQDITDRKKVEDSIRTIVEGVRTGSSSDFFESLALQVSKATGAEHAFIGRLIEGDEPAIRLLGHCVNRAIAENVTFDLNAGGLAAEVIRNGRVTSYRSKIASHFPDLAALRDLEAEAYVGIPLLDACEKAIGIMAVMFKAPLDDPSFVESVLQVFSKWTAAEIERSQAEERFSTAFRSSPEGCAIAILRTGEFIEANDSFLRMLEYRRDEVIGKLATELNHWESSEQRSEILRKVRETGKVREEAVRFRAKSGRVVEARFSGEVVQLQNEACLLGIARDVTEQNVLEEKLRQSQKMEAVGMLAGGVAHDFNNLLGVIIGYSEMLSSSAAPNSPTLKKIDAIKQAAQRAAMLTTQLLAYSRKQAIQPRVSNLNSLVSETEKMLRRLIGENIQLVVIQEAKLDYVNVDPGQIVQVLMNLGVNARDAMPKKGTLTIETKNILIEEGTRDGISPGHYVRLSVSDTGTGMDEVTKSQIFEPFFTTKEPGRGTGLGLATVQGIVEQCGGRIRVESKLGIGTRFEIYLPKVHDGVPTQETDLAGPKTPSGSATILLVEDEVAMRMVIDESLRSQGYRVLAAGNGLDALRLAEQYHAPIDLLITDVIMPAMSGPEVAQALSTSRPGIPVLYISGYTADKLSYYPELEPDMALLQKPFKLNILTQKVRDLIGSVAASSSGQ